MFGTPYYSFRYKDVLFLCMFSNEGFQVISEEQIAYFKQVLADNEDVRWTMVFLHHPLWIYPHATGFGAVEDLIADRRYSVFAGHHHQYHYYNRKGQNYYVLATTGGGSGLLGNSFGQFDHVTWVTMTDEGPQLANLRLDGILPHDIANNETAALCGARMISVRFDTDVYVDDPKAFQSGVVKLTYTNDSDRPLYVRGRFYHHHQIQFFGAVYKGKIDLPESGTYTWSAISDEGIIIYLNGKAVVVDAVKHKEREATGTIDLEQGINSLEMHYYQRKKNLRADVFFTTPSGKKVHLQGSMMTYGEVR